jgi:hypothetical protein
MRINIQKRVIASSAGATLNNGAEANCLAFDFAFNSDLGTNVTTIVSYQFPHMNVNMQVE